MDDYTMEHIENEKLKKNINDLRDVLNEICSSIESCVNTEERLKVSQYLDEMIVQYMNELKKK